MWNMLLFYETERNNITATNKKVQPSVIKFIKYNKLLMFG